MDRFSDGEKRAFLGRAADIRAAIAAGAAFAPALPRVLPELAPDELHLVAPSQARVFILTDHACFSSCLLMTDRFRRGGAAHIGTETDFSTRYMEVRAVALPSGEASISTLQKVALGQPDRLGPYTPVTSFDGDIDDDAAVEQWVMSLRS
jgi:hypothetical protein